MSARIAFLTLLLTGCVSAPLGHYQDVLFSDELNKAKPIAPLPYDPADLKSFAVAPTIVLRIRQHTLHDANEARDEISRKVEILRRFLAKQVDPYRGEFTAKSECKIADRDAEQFVKTESELSLTLSLTASKNYAVDCYGKQSDGYQDALQFLYCIKTGAFYEINLYSQASSLTPALARCRD